jgi:hypothetical protein
VRFATRAAYTWQVVDNGKVGGAVAEGALSKGDQRAGVPETGGQHSTRALAHCGLHQGDRRA